MSTRYWIPGLKRRVTDFVRTCHRYQFSRHSTAQPSGLTRPLELPPLSPGSHLSTDFTFDLPVAEHPITKVEYSGVQVYVCRLTGRVRFLPVNPEITAEQAAILYHTEVRPQWGQAAHLLSDRDPRFTSECWVAFTKASGMKMAMSTTDHPQTVGQSEQVFAMLSVMLRAFCSVEQRSWVEFLPDLEFALNTHPRRSRNNFSSFEIWQGFRPLEAADLIHPALVAAVGEAAADRIANQQRAASLAKDCLAMAQDARAAVKDSHRRPISFAPGDQVLVHMSALVPPSEESRSKLAKRKGCDQWNGPFEAVHQRADAVRVTELPQGSKAHPVFNVAVVKPWHTNPFQADPRPSAIPELDEDGVPVRTVGAILKHRRRRNRDQWRVRWAGLSTTFDSWHELPTFVSSQGVTQSLLAFEEARMGNTQHIWAALGKNPLPAQYPTGDEGAYSDSRDGFRLYHAVEGQSVRDVAHVTGSAVKDLIRWNRPQVQSVRESSVFPLGFAVRIGPAQSSPRILMSLCAVQVSGQPGRLTDVVDANATGRASRYTMFLRR